MADVTPTLSCFCAALVIILRAIVKILKLVSQKLYCSHVCQVLLMINEMINRIDCALVIG